MIVIVLNQAITLDDHPRRAGDVVQVTDNFDVDKYARKVLKRIEKKPKKPKDKGKDDKAQ